MADEILIVELSHEERGARVRYVFLHPIAPTLKTVDNTLIVPTPAGSLPPNFVALGLLQDTATLDALNDGSLAVEIDALYISEDEIGNLAEVRRKLRVAYNGSRFVERLRRRFKHTGRKLDAS